MSTKDFAETLVEELVSAAAAYYDSDLQTDPFRLARLQKAKADAIQALRVPPPEAEDLTIRDRFAMAALQGFLAGTSTQAQTLGEDYVAENAFSYADAMMAARKAVAP